MVHLGKIRNNFGRHYEGASPMNPISRFADIAVVAAVLLASSAPAKAQTAAPHTAQVCLKVYDIKQTETPDDKTIVFHMRDGTVWRNTLKTPCPMLKISPFTEVVHNDEVCANQQFIHVNLTGNACVLGEFTPVATGR
jgi:hypothetical protein